MPMGTLLLGRHHFMDVFEVLGEIGLVHDFSRLLLIEAQR